VSRVIAGSSDIRAAQSCRTRFEREESPDTVVVGSRELVTKKGDAPDNVREPATQALRKQSFALRRWRWVKPGAVRLRYGKCHRE
jgi:hypothetical protein